MKKIFLFIATAFLGTGIYAQRNSFTLSYPISFPMANLHDYISNTSGRGLSLEFNKRFKPNLDIGLEAGWNVFNMKEDSKTYTDGTVSISGVQYRNTNIVPVILGAKFYKTGKKCSPYVGAGLGILYVNRSTDFGLYRITTETVPFCIRPEAGILIGLRSGLSGLLGIKYYGAFKTDDLDSQSFLSLNMGVVLHY
jgi:hypothetical protein